MYLMWAINPKHWVFWFPAKQVITDEMVLRDLDIPGQVKTRYPRPSSELAMAPAKHEGKPASIGEHHQNQIKSLCLETIKEGRDPLECL